VKKKICTICRVEKPVPGGFYSNGKKPGSDKVRWSSACRECTKENSRARYHADENKEDNRTRRREYHQKTRNKRLSRALERHREIREHQDPDLIPWQEWHDGISFHKKDKWLTWKDLIRITGIFNVENQCRGLAWPPELSVGRKVLRELEAMQPLRPDIEQWSSAVLKLKDHLGCTLTDLDRMFLLPPGMLSRQLKGHKPPPLMEEAEWMVRRAQGLPATMPDRIRKRMVQKQIHLPGGQVYVKVDYSDAP